MSWQWQWPRRTPHSLAAAWLMTNKMFWLLIITEIFFFYVNQYLREQISGKNMCGHGIWRTPIVRTQFEWSTTLFQLLEHKMKYTNLTHSTCFIAVLIIITNGHDLEFVEQATTLHRLKCIFSHTQPPQHSQRKCWKRIRQKWASTSCNTTN